MKPDLIHILSVTTLTAGVFFILDLFWLGVVAKGLYAHYVGALMRDRVNWTAAILFYAIYIGGILLFVVVPALQDGSGIFRVAMMGGLLGFFAYSTFDLTCLALIRNWSVTVTVVDMLWGTVLTGSASAAAVWLARAVLKIG